MEKEIMSAAAEGEINKESANETLENEVARLRAMIEDDDTYSGLRDQICRVEKALENAEKEIGTKKMEAMLQEVPGLRMDDGLHY